MRDAPKAVWSIPYVSEAFFQVKTILLHIILLKCPDVQIAFLKKAWTHISLAQLWVSRRIDWALYHWWDNQSRRKKTNTSCTPLKNWPWVVFCSWGRGWASTHTHTHSLSLSLSFSHWHRLSLFLSHTHRETLSLLHARPTHRLSLSLFLSYTHRYFSLTYTNTNTDPLSLSLSLLNTHGDTLLHRLSNRLSLYLSHTHIHTRI